VSLQVVSYFDASSIFLAVAAVMGTSGSACSLSASAAQMHLFDKLSFASPQELRAVLEPVRSSGTRHSTKRARVASAPNSRDTLVDVVTHQAEMAHRHIFSDIFDVVVRRRPSCCSAGLCEMTN
jgi:hypothetical protein